MNSKLCEHTTYTLKTCLGLLCSMEVRNNSGFVNKSGQEYKWDDNIFLEMARSPELSEGREAVLCPTVLFQG